MGAIARAELGQNGLHVSFDGILQYVLQKVTHGSRPQRLASKKRGDTYLRTLLVHGARAAIAATRRRGKSEDSWLPKLLDRRHTNLASVALANKNARILWALMAYGRDFDPAFVPTRCVA
jgi:transposase